MAAYNLLRDRANIPVTASRIPQRTSKPSNDNKVNAIVGLMRKGEGLFENKYPPKIISSIGNSTIRAKE